MRYCFLLIHYNVIRSLLFSSSSMTTDSWPFPWSRYFEDRHRRCCWLIVTHTFLLQQHHFLHSNVTLHYKTKSLKFQFNQVHLFVPTSFSKHYNDKNYLLLKINKKCIIVSKECIILSTFPLELLTVTQKNNFHFYQIKNTRLFLLSSYILFIVFQLNTQKQTNIYKRLMWLALRHEGPSAQARFHNWRPWSFTLQTQRRRYSPISQLLLCNQPIA